jgi:hypothetical protein
VPGGGFLLEAEEKILQKGQFGLYDLKPGFPVPVIHVSSIDYCSEGSKGPEEGDQGSGLYFWAHFCSAKTALFAPILADFRFNRLRGTGALETAGAVNDKTRSPAREF